MPWFFSRGFDNIPTMDWKKIHLDVFYRFSRWMNAIGGNELLKSSVDRTMIDANVIINVNGVREDAIYNWYHASLPGQPSVYDLAIPNIKLFDVNNGNARVVDNAPISSIVVSYVIELNPQSGWTSSGWADCWSSKCSIDGQRMAAGDCITNYKFLSYDLRGDALIQLSGFFIAEVLHGEHQLNIVLDIPYETQIVSAEVNLTRLNW